MPGVRAVLICLILTGIFQTKNPFIPFLARSKRCFWCIQSQDVLTVTCHLTSFKTKCSLCVYYFRQNSCPHVYFRAAYPIFNNLWVFQWAQFSALNYLLLNCRWPSVNNDESLCCTVRIKNEIVKLGEEIQLSVGISLITPQKLEILRECLPKMFKQIVLWLWVYCGKSLFYGTKTTGFSLLFGTANKVG